MIDPGGSGGILPVDKPPGPTSHDIVARARRALAIRRVGHTGTLDPFASGLLLLCVGPATRLAEYLTGLDKTYLATALLGQGTTTDDAEGEVVHVSGAWRALSRAEVEEALGRLRGRILQVPPRYSAKKVGGERMYARARRGEPVTLDAVEVEVHELELLELAPPRVHFHLRCSSGTYVRALARDLGEDLGVGAHLVGLRRTRVGPFRVEDAVAADRLHEDAAVARAWIPPDRALPHLPHVELEPAEAARMRHGGAVPVDPSAAPEGVPVAVVAGGSLVAVAARRGPLLRPSKVFAG